MRIITLDSRVLQQTTSDLINSVPYFSDEKCEGGRVFKSNMYNFENKISIIGDLCYTQFRSDQVISLYALKVSNVVSIYDQASEMYWVVKNRHTGREGWHTKSEFKYLVLKEVDGLDTDLTTL